MDSFEVRRILDDISSGKASVDALDDVAGRLGLAGLEGALDYIREKAEVSDYPADLASLTRLTADLLVRCAGRVDLKVAGPLAEAAADIFRTDLGDSESAERASTLSTLLGLDPLVLAVLHDTHEAQLPEDLRIRVLQVATALGDSSLDAYRQKLEALVEARDKRLREEARLKGRFEQARAAMATGAPDDETLELLVGHLEDNPSDREALQVAAGTLGRLGRAKEAVGLYAAGVAAAQGAREQATLLCDLGTLRLGAIDDPAGAFASFEEALAVDRRAEGVVEGYVRALTRLGRLEDAVGPLEKIRTEPVNRAEEARILPVLADVYSALGRTEDAEKAWRRLRAIDPRSIAALRFYEDYHEARQDFQKLFTTLQFALSVVEANDEKVRINRKMASLAEGVLANPDRAIEAYKRVLGVLPRDPETETALVSLYEKTGKWHALVEFYNERLRHLPAEDVAHRIETLYHIVDIYRDPTKLPGDDNVLATFARIVEVAPGTVEALETLERGYRARARWPDLLKILQKKVLITTEPAALLELLRRIADIAITRMSNEALALPYLERILEIDAHDLDVLQKLKAVYQKKNNPEKLYALYERELQLQTGHDRVPVLSAAAALARDKLLRYEEALRLYEELYLLEPNLREARENLHQLYARLERWSDYARFLSEEVRRPMPARRRIDISHRLGEVLQDRLGDVPAARKVFEAVLVEEPNDDISVRRLEQIYLDMDELPSLHALFARRNDVRSYVAMLAQREAREEVPSRKVALLQAMATACEDDLNEASRALRYLERAWALDRSLVDVGRKLLDAWESIGDMERVIAILPELAPLVPSIADRLDLNVRLHRALAALGRWQDAFEAGAEAVRLSLGLGNSPSALEAVRETASAGSLWTEFAALLEEVSAATMDAEWRLALLLELGEVYKNRLLFFDEARQVLDRVLDLDPANVTAMDMLEDIALQREDYTGLEGVLRRRVDVSTDPIEIRDIRMRLGRLYEDLLGDDASAGECYMAVVHAVPGDREALAGLHRTYERADQHVELADVIRMEIAETTGDRERARLQCDLAQLLWEHLDDPQEAISLLASALESPPATEEARRQLTELFERRVARDAAANVLAPFYRNSGRTDDLLELLYARFDDMTRPEARAAILMEIADIHEHEKEDPDGALDMVLQAIAMHPAEGYVERLLALADRVDRVADAAVAIGRWVGIVPDDADSADLPTHPDPVREAALALRLGRLYADRLDRTDLAILAFEKALPFQDEDEALLTELLGLYRKLGDIDAILLTYDRLVDAVADDAARREVLLARALFAREAGRNGDAIETLRRVLGLFDGDPAASAELEDLLTVEGRWIEVIEVLDRREKLATSASERAELLYQTAILLRDPLQDPSGAADRLRRAVAEAPDRPEYRVAAEGLVLDRTLPGHADFAPALLPVLEEVLRAARADDELIALLRVKADMAGSAWERVVALTDIATIEMLRERPDAAFEALRPAIEATPDDPALLELIVTAGTAADLIPSLVETLELAAIEACADGRMRILLRVADIARTRLEDPARALDIYRQLLDERPGTLPVLRELDGLLATEGREDERIPVLAEIVASSPAMDDKRETQLRIGDLARAAGRDADAATAFRFVLDNRPAPERLDALALEAADRLIALFCADGEARPCVELHLLVGRTCEDPVRARDELMTAGRTLYGTFGEALEAVALFEEVLAKDPADREARDQAKACARDLQDDERLRDLLVAEIDQAADDAARIGPRMELADLFLSRETTRSDALEVLGKVLATDPANVEARGLVSGFLEDGDRAGVSAALLEAAAAKTGDLSLLATALAVQVEHAGDVPTRNALRLRLGQSLREQGRPDEAVAVVGDAYAEQPAEPDVVQTLIELLTATDRLPELATLTLDAVPALPEPDRLAIRFSAAVTLFQAGHSAAAATLLEANVAEDPAHEASLELLATAYSSVSRWQDVLRVIDLVATAATDDEARAAQYLRSADVALIELEDPRKAIAAYRRVVDLFPLHPTALAELANLYREVRDAAGLAWLRAHELTHLEARGEAADASRIAELRRLLTTAALDASDEAVAVEGALKMLEADRPGADDLAIGRRVYAEAGSPAPLFAALVSAYGRIGDREGQLDLYRFAAQLDLEEPTRGDALRGAIDLAEALGLDGILFEDLMALVTLEPGDAALRARMEAAGRRLGRMEDVREALADGFSRCQDQPVAFDVASAIARILGEDLGRHEEAADYLRVAFLRKPDDVPTVDALTALYRRLSRFGDLALMFETLGDYQTDRDLRIQRYFEAFDVVRGQVGDPIGAAEVLRKILDEDASNRRALDELETIARETDDAATLVTALRSKAESTALPVERRAIVLELARVLEEKVGDPQAAIGTLKELIITEPASLDAYRQIEPLLVAAEAWDELAGIYESEADHAAGSDDRIEALKKAAAVREGKLSERTVAVHHLRRILELEPANRYAFVRLGELLEEGGEWIAYAELLKGRLAQEAGLADQVALNARIGRVLFRETGDSTGAVEYFKAALLLDPYCEEARTGLEEMLERTDVAMDAAVALEALYDATGRYEQLCEVLGRELGLVETTGEREAILVRIAEVHRDRLADPAGALAYFGRALDENPANADTVARMDEVAESSRLWDREYSILQETLRGLKDREVRSRLNRRAAALAETKLGSPSGAATHYAALLRDSPDDEAVLGRLDRLYTELHRADDLAQVLRMRISLARDASATELRLRLAAVLTTELNDPDGAVEQLRIVLTGDPVQQDAIRQLSSLSNHSVAGRHALEVLSVAFRESGDLEGLVWALERQIESASEVVDTVALHDEAAAAAAGLKRWSVQIRHLGEALELVPSDEALLARLVAVAREHALEDEAIRHLRIAATLASWPDLQRLLLLHASRLAIVAGAWSTDIEGDLVRVLELDPLCREAIDLLEREYGMHGDTSRLREILAKKLRLDLAPNERIATLCRLAEIAVERREPAVAIQSLEECWNLEPGNATTLDRLRALYQETGDAAGEVSAVERLAAIAADSAGRVRCLLDIAKLQVEGLGDASSARATLEGVLAIEPANEAAKKGLESLYEELGEWEPLINQLNTVIFGTGAVADRVAAALKAAVIHEAHMDNVTTAVSLLRRAADIDPKSVAVLDELVRLSYRIEDWGGMVNVLRRKAALVTDRGVKVALLAQACETALSQLNDLSLAGAVAQEIIALDASHPKALLVMAHLMESRSQTEDALGLFRKLVEAAGERDERVEALLGVARILLARGEKGDEVRQALQAAVRDKPDHPEVNRHLKRLYLEGGEHDAVIEVVMRELKQAQGEAEKATLCMDIAEIYQRHLNDGASFLKWAEEAHGHKRDDPRVVAGIVNHHLNSGEPRRAVPYLEWLVNYLEGKRRLKELPPYAHELGRILEGMGETDKAIQYYRMCHEHDAGNLPNALALGRLYMVRNEQEKALRVLQPLILRIDSLAGPARVEVLMALANINLAKGDRRKARQYVLRVLSEEPDNSDAQALLAQGL